MLETSVRWNKAHRVTRETWIVLLFVFFFFTFHLFYLASVNSAFGTDGYYYAAQTRFFRQHGHFFSPETSPVLYLMVAVSYLFSDIVFSNKTVTALLSASCVIPAFALGKRVCGSFGGGLVGIFLIAGNSSVMLLNFEFVKNLGGLVALLYALVPLYDILVQGRHNIGYFLLMSLGFLLAFLCHRLTGVIAFYFFAAVMLSIFRRYTFLLTGIVIFLAATGLLLSWKKGFPGLLHPSDLERFADTFTVSPQIAVLSYRNLTQPHSVIFLENTTLTAAGICAALFLFGLVVRKLPLNGRDTFIALVIALLPVLQFPFLRFTDYDLAYRLFLLSFLPGSFGTLYLLSRLSVSRMHVLYFLFFFLFCFHIWAFIETGNRRKNDTGVYSTLVEKLNLRFRKEEIEKLLLITHQGLDYYFCYQSSIDAFHFLPEEQHKNRLVFRLVYGLETSEWKKFAPGMIMEPLEKPYTLVREGDWEKFLSALPAQRRALYLTWRNPHESRPEFLLRNYRTGK